MKKNVETLKTASEPFNAVRRLLSCLPVCMVILFLGLIAPRSSFAQPIGKDVNVVNTPNVNVVNSPVVQSQQSGPWSVGILGTPAVTVGNTQANPVPVIASQPVPFQQEVAFQFNAGSTGGFAALAVPAGKRLVIEYVSATAALAEGQQLSQTRLDILQFGGGSVSGHYFAASFQAHVPGIADYYAISQQTRLYAVGAVGIAAFRSDTAGLAQMNVSVSGYLIDQ